MFAEYYNWNRHGRYRWNINSDCLPEQNHWPNCFSFFPDHSNDAEYRWNTTAVTRGARCMSRKVWRNVSNIWALAYPINAIHTWLKTHFSSTRLANLHLTLAIPRPHIAIPLIFLVQPAWAKSYGSNDNREWMMKTLRIGSLIQHPRVQDIARGTRQVSSNCPGSVKLATDHFRKAMGRPLRSRQARFKNLAFGLFLVHHCCRPVGLFISSRSLSTSSRPLQLRALGRGKCFLRCQCPGFRLRPFADGRHCRAGV